jgi:replication-associated recombination protein RarA
MLENKYRPQSWGELILPKAGKTLMQIACVKQALDKREWPLRVMVIGESGTGKTTLARVIAKAAGNLSVLQEVDGRDVTAGLVKTWREWFTARNVFGQACVIVNEAQNFGAASSGLMTLCDSMKSGILIMTTMNTQKVVFANAQEDEAITGRCLTVNITTQGLAEQAASRLLEIARLESKDFGDDGKRTLRLLQDNHNNIRKALQAIEAGALCPAGDVANEWARNVLAA